MTGPLGVFREIPARPGSALDAMAALADDARLPAFVDAPAGAHARLQRADVVVVGAGSVGQGCLDSLARLRPRRLRIVDYAAFKPESVLTHPVGPDVIGRPKAAVAGERVKAVSPRTRVLVHEGALQGLPRGALLGADSLLLFSDNLAAEVEASRRAVELGLPLLQASVHGATLTAHVRGFENRHAGAAKLCCAFGSATWEDLERGTTFSCERGSDRGAAPLPAGAPTTSPAALCAVAAQLAMCAWLRRTLLDASGDASGDAPGDASGDAPGDASGEGRGGSPGGGPGEAWELEYSGYRASLVRTTLAPRAECRGHHERLAVRPLATPTPFGRATPRDVLAAGGWDGGDLRAHALELEGFDFVGLALCPCSPHRRVDRFVAAAQPLPPCAAGHRGAPHPLYAWRVAPASALAGVLDVPLAELGAARASSALVRGPDGSATALVHAPLEEGVAS